MPAAAHPPRYRVADMCAGTGAFSHALASTGGFYPVYAHDLSPHAEAMCWMQKTLTIRIYMMKPKPISIARKITIKRLVNNFYIAPAWVLEGSI